MQIQDDRKNSIHICPKCDKWMANSEDTIKNHDELFCEQILKAKKKKRKPAKEKASPKKKKANGRKKKS